TRQSTPSLRLGAGMTADQALLADTYEVRLHVEQSCAELAALRRTNENLIEMRLALDEMAEAVKNHTNGTPADVRFHLAIARATHNEAMLKLLRFLHGSLEESVQLARVNSEKTPGQPQKTQLEHQSIYAAIEAADPLAARLAVKAHLDGAANRLGLRVGPHPQADVQSKVASDRQENK
ncbi:FadR/GntR family transcriptional regulator, partial [Curvibacter delicatus]|uniref:FadR/GntR family transcriptional regulator n=1 Tax=Curvibacter delicatus TaxID=80879 RepID=UPI0009FF6EA1